MNVLVILILASLGLAVCFLGAFIWAVRGGQFEDTCTPSLRMLTDEAEVTPNLVPTAIQTNRKQP